jgi:hypothetical protein
VHELDGAEAGRTDDEVVFSLDTVDLDALLCDLGYLAGFERNVGLVEGGEVVVADNNTFAADGIVRGQLFPPRVSGSVVKIAV